MKFGSYRNTSVYIPNTAYINISKEVAAYNVSKGLLYPIQYAQCPPNAMCAQVVRYSYVNPCAYVTQPCPQYAAQITEYVPSDAKIYSVMPDCPPNARCIPTLYAAKGKVNPVLEMPSGKTKYIVTKTNEFTSPPFKVGDIFEGTLDGRNITTSQIMFEGKPTNFTFILGVDAKEYNSNNIGSMLTKKFDNIALGMLAATWGINGYLAYKFWAKSMMWKVGIVAATAANTYSTLKYLKKRKENNENTAPTTSDKSIISDKQGIVNEIIANILNSPNTDNTLTQAQKSKIKDDIIKGLSTLSIDDLKIAKEYVTELLKINFKAAPEIFLKEFSDLVIKFNGKYGEKRMAKILQVLNPDKQKL